VSGICLLNSISHRGFKNISIDIFQLPELNTIPRYAGLAELFSKCLGEVLPVFYSHYVDGDACGVCAYANLIELSGFSIGILYRPRSVTYVGVGNCSALFVFAIKEPQFTARQQAQNDAVKFVQVTPLSLRLSCNIVFDLSVYVNTRLLCLVSCLRNPNGLAFEFSGRRKRFAGMMG
jgi:hypothetical protein